MERIIRAIFTTYYNLLSSIRGECSFKEIFKHNRIILRLKASSTSNYSIVINCRKRQYTRKNSNSYFYGKVYTVFDVFAEVDEHAPELIKNAFSVTISFPPLISLYASEEVHARLLINAYIDMVNVRLKDHIVLTNPVVH